MAIVAGFDVHRAQITFDALDTATGEITGGRIDATPTAVGRWVARFAAGEVDVDVAVAACTGWLFVCDALAAAGATPHLAEPVETRALRGRERRSKTDREDARWLRELLSEGRLPEAWIPPEHVIGAGGHRPRADGTFGTPCIWALLEAVCRRPNVSLDLRRAGLPPSALFVGEEAIMRYLTRLTSERRTHLTGNGAVTLCGRAITNKWRRTVRAGDRACNHCHERASAMAAVQVAPGSGRVSTAERVIPA
jgi:hypothetical protein